MTRHSKNNTSSSVFTYAERSKLQYGTVEKRHSRDTVKDVHACYLCFLSAVDPVCCSEGHVSCRECIISALLSQKAAEKEALVKEKAMKKIKHELELEEERKAALEKEKEFVKAFKGKGCPEKTISTSLPSCSFWIPEKTPQAPLSIEGKKRPITGTLCYGGPAPHSVSLKSLIRLRYAVDNTGSRSEEKICPSCTQTFNNNMQLAVFKECGHVFCGECIQLTGKTTAESVQCISCGEASSQVIYLQKEGTGFASGGGQVSIVKYELPFQ